MNLVPGSHFQKNKKLHIQVISIHTHTHTQKMFLILKISGCVYVCIGPEVQEKFLVELVNVG